MKSVTDSGGFDSPRSSHTRSLKTPSETRGEDEEKRRGGGVKEGAWNKSISRVVRAGGSGGSSSRRRDLFEVYTLPSPSFFPPSLLIFHFFLTSLVLACLVSFLPVLLSFSLPPPVVIPRVCTLDAATLVETVYPTSMPWRFLQHLSFTITNSLWLLSDVCNSAKYKL